MIRFERTRDYALVASILTHPEIYPYLISDGAPSRDEFTPGRGEHLWYVLAFDGDDFLGLFFCVPLNAVTWELHTCLLPGSARRHAIAVYREGLAWLWANSPCRKAVGFIPEDNGRALAVALRGGLTKIGVLTKSIQKGGRLLDQTIVAAGAINHG